jgi:nucleoid-associated protein YgaU
MNRALRLCVIGFAAAALGALPAAAADWSLPEPVPGDGILMYEPVFDPAVPADGYADCLAVLWSADPGVPAEAMVFTPILELAQAGSPAADAPLKPQDVPPGLLNNQYYRDSLKEKKLADEDFDLGDYDAAAVHAAEAGRLAILSDNYIAEQLRLKAERDAAERARLAAEKAARDKAEADRLAALEAARLKAEADALAARQAADAAALAASRQAEADRLAAEAARLQAVIAEVDAAIAAAKDKLAAAVSIGADQVSPAPYKSARGAYDSALAARTGKDWATALTQAQRVAALLEGIKGYATLPATYKVRPWSQSKDCFWNIAAYPFVYGDATKWKVLYEANKKKLKRPDNPDLLNVGIVLDIPSLKGEVRSGAWSSDAVYAPPAAK